MVDIETIKSKIKNNPPKLTAVIDKKNPEQIYQYTSQNIDAVTYPIDIGDITPQPPALPSTYDPKVMKEKTISKSTHKNFDGSLKCFLLN